MRLLEEMGRVRDVIGILKVKLSHYQTLERLEKGHVPLYLN